MKRSRVLLASLASAALVISGAPAQAAPGVASGYLIGAAAPLTTGQVDQLTAAGAQVRTVYRNFGGAAAVIPAGKVDAVRSLDFVTSVGADPVRRPAATGAPGARALPGTPYWHDLIGLDQTSYTGAGVWVAVLDSGFYPNWRDYFVESDILADKARAFVGVNGNQNANRWDVGSDPHGMAVSATIVGHRFADDTNEGGWGSGYATGAAGTYWVPGVAPNAKIIP